MEVEDSIWFTPAGTLKTIGIVLVKTSGGGHKAYIGLGNGISQRADELFIAQMGARYHEARVHWPRITDWEE